MDSAAYFLDLDGILIDPSAMRRLQPTNSMGLAED